MGMIYRPAKPPLRTYSRICVLIFSLGSIAETRHRYVFRYMGRVYPTRNNQNCSPDISPFGGR